MDAIQKIELETAFRRMCFKIAAELNGAFLYCLRQGTSLEEIATRIDMAPESFMERLSDPARLGLRELSDLAYAMDAEFAFSLVRLHPRPSPSPAGEKE